MEIHAENVNPLPHTFHLAKLRYEEWFYSVIQIYYFKYIQSQDL